MKYVDIYNKYAEKTKDLNFDSYIRNKLLPHFFPIADKTVTICDIAGGSGIVSEWLICRGYQTTLVEFDNIAIKEAKRRNVTNIKTRH